MQQLSRRDNFNPNGRGTQSEMIQGIRREREMTGVCGFATQSQYEQRCVCSLSNVKQRRKQNNNNHKGVIEVYTIELSSRGE